MPPWLVIHGCVVPLQIVCMIQDGSLAGVVNDCNDLRPAIRAGRGLQGVATAVLVGALRHSGGATLCHRKNLRTLHSLHVDTCTLPFVHNRPFPQLRGRRRPAPGPVQVPPRRLLPSCRDRGSRPRMRWRRRPGRAGLGAGMAAAVERQQRALSPAWGCAACCSWQHDIGEWIPNSLQHCVIQR